MAESQKVLVVEDEAPLAEVLEYNLEREGFEVAIIGRGDEVLDAVRASRPDLVILDLMLPGLDGLDVMRAMKRDESLATLPVIVLTAKGEEIDRIVGLELGADDDIAKPFSPREVLLRVRAVLRRAGSERSSTRVLEAGDMRLDIPGHRLAVDGVEIQLTATEFRLLRLLMERRGRVQTRDVLLTEAWGYASDVDSRTVDTHVRRLRAKLGAEAGRIETVIGVGYRFRS
jgi:two-component system phosphate regulon response regulator PhoB